MSAFSLVSIEDDVTEEVVRPSPVRVPSPVLKLVPKVEPAIVHPPLREWNAHHTDPGDDCFIAFPFCIEWPTDVGRVHYSILYRPTVACLAWDKPPDTVNVATGHRHGWSYAELKVTGRGIVKAPASIGRAVKCRIRWSHSLFPTGWETSEWNDAWIPAYVRADVQLPYHDRHLSFEEIVGFLSAR